VHQAYELLKNKEGFNLWSKNIWCKGWYAGKKLPFVVLITRKVFRNFY